jgi:hypothetical protein
MLLLYTSVVYVGSTFETLGDTRRGSSATLRLPDYVWLVLEARVVKATRRGILCKKVQQIRSILCTAVMVPFGQPTHDYESPA